MTTDHIAVLDASEHDELLVVAELNVIPISTGNNGVHKATIITIPSAKPIPNATLLLTWLMEHESMQRFDDTFEWRQRVRSSALTR